MPWTWKATQTRCTVRRLGLAMPLLPRVLLGGAHARPDVPVPADDQREQFLRHWGVCCIMSELERQLFDLALGLTARQSSHRWRSCICQIWRSAWRPCSLSLRQTAKSESLPSKLLAVLLAPACLKTMMPSPSAEAAITWTRPCPSFARNWRSLSTPMPREPRLWTMLPVAFWPVKPTGWWTNLAIAWCRSCCFRSWVARNSRPSGYGCPPGEMPISARREEYGGHACLLQPFLNVWSYGFQFCEACCESRLGHQMCGGPPRLWATLPSPGLRLSFAAPWRVRALISPLDCSLYTLEYYEAAQSKGRTWPAGPMACGRFLPL